jgi:hypothetical protein
MKHLRIREDAVEDVLPNDDALNGQGQEPPEPTLSSKVIAASFVAADALIKNPWEWRCGPSDSRRV